MSATMWSYHPRNLIFSPICFLHSMDKRHRSEGSGPLDMMTLETASKMAPYKVCIRQVST